MGIVAVKIKLMPESLDVDLEKLQKNAKSLIEKQGGKNISFSEEPIAFGLKAIIVLFAWPEEKELENIERDLEKLKGIKSVHVMDIRRAFG